MDLKKLSDEEVVACLQRVATDGDTFAPEALPYLEVLYERYFDKVTQWAQMAGVKKQEAGDVAQEAFIRLYYRCHSYDPSRPFRFWFFKLVYNLSMTYLKRQQRYFSLEEHMAFEDIPEEEKNFSEKFQFWHVFQGILYEMPEKLRVVVMWHLLEDMSFDEIAHILNISSRQVRNRYDKALEWVRQRLGRDIGDER
ncbi:MAG: sigma-70 family RNA polymerase sigma factor [Brevinematales bacterium]|nr:sigma-70 family RNA polymerase sigma factor [Brevinematales bacterium]